MGLAAELANYLSGLTVTQGRLAGQPFPVFPWEGRFVRRAFALDIGEAALSIARGNGKSTFTAGLAAALDGPLAVPRGEVVAVASSFDQSRIIFNHVLAFLRAKHGESFEDRSLWRVQDSANKAHVVNRQTGATLKCIGSDPRRAHGLAPFLILADEPAQWESGKAEAMVAALRISLGKIPGGRLIALGTRPADEGHWFSQLLSGGADYAQCHAAPPDSPKGQRKMWLRANPLVLQRRISKYGA